MSKILLGCAAANLFFAVTNVFFWPNPANVVASAVCAVVLVSDLAVWAVVRHDA